MSLPRLAPLLPALLGVLVYLNAVNAEFVYDDLSYVQENPSVSGEAPIFSEALPPHRKDLGLYRPVTVSTYRWTHARFGLDPFAFHLVNVMLHAAASALVFAAGVRLGATRAVALAGASIFAVHPIHVEAVAWVVGRAEILCTSFALLALVTFGRPGDRRGALRAILAAAFYALAALAKETALPFPALLFALDVASRGRASIRTCVARQVPFAVACGAIVAARIAVLDQFGPSVAGVPFLDSLDVLDRLALALIVIGKSLERFVLPTSLTIYYDTKDFQGATPLLVGIALGAAAVLLAWKSRAPVVRSGLLLVGVGLLPFLHLVPIGSIFADRFVYLPSAGACLVLAYLLFRAGHRFGVVATVGVTLLFGGMTLARNPAFHTTFRLWEDAAGADPTSAMPQFQLGMMYKRAGLFDYQSERRKGALHHWQEALRLDPTFPFAAQANVELGEYAAGTIGDAEMAARHYRAALAVAPDYIDAMLDLAVLHRTGIVTRTSAAELLERATLAGPDERQRGIIALLQNEIDASGDG